MLGGSFTHSSACDGDGENDSACEVLTIFAAVIVMALDEEETLLGLALDEEKFGVTTSARR